MVTKFGEEGKCEIVEILCFISNSIVSLALAMGKDIFNVEIPLTTCFLGPLGHDLFQESTHHGNQLLSTDSDAQGYTINVYEILRSTEGSHQLRRPRILASTSRLELPSWNPLLGFGLHLRSGEGHGRPLFKQELFFENVCTSYSLQFFGLPKKKLWTNCAAFVTKPGPLYKMEKAAPKLMSNIKASPLQHSILVRVHQHSCNLNRICNHHS